MAKLNGKKLEEYIERQLEKGFSLHRVKHELVAVGHPVEAIENAQANVFLRKPYLKRAPRSPKFLTLFLLGIVATALVVFVVIKVAEHQSYEKTVAELERNKTYELLQDVELLQQAKLYDDPNACDFVNNHVMRLMCAEKVWKRQDCQYELFAGENVSKCLYEKAISNKNVSLCELDFADESRNACVRQFVDTVIVKERGDRSLCDGSSWCWTYLAARVKDLSLCQKQEDILSCVREAAKLANDPSVCETIVEPDCQFPIKRSKSEGNGSNVSYGKCELRASCLLATRKGEQLLRKSYCGSPIFSSLAELESRLIDAGIYSYDNKSLYKGLSRASYCIIQFVTAGADASLCNMISADSAREKSYYARCIIASAKAKKNVEFCTSLSGAWGTLCSAILQSNSEICSSISDAIDRGRCRFWVDHEFGFDDEYCFYDPVTSKQNQECTDLKLSPKKIYSEEFVFGR